MMIRHCSVGDYNQSLNQRFSYQAASFDGFLANKSINNSVAFTLPIHGMDGPQVGTHDDDIADYYDRPWHCYCLFSNSKQNISGSFFWDMLSLAVPAISERF